jgi:hypothetical protein
MPHFQSGATKQIGRFCEGLLLRRLHNIPALPGSPVRASQANSAAVQSEFEAR